MNTAEVRTDDEGRAWIHAGNLQIPYTW